MRPDEFNEPPGRGRRGGGRFALFFYEQDRQGGTRYYLRFTSLALALVVCLTVIPAAAIFAIFFTQSRVDFGDVNINMRGEPRAPGNYNRIIPAPPPPALPTPRVSRSPRGGDPARQTPAAPNLNANAPPTPSPTPSPTPPKPPT
jgi:hypothetical protein